MAQQESPPKGAGHRRQHSHAIFQKSIEKPTIFTPEMLESYEHYKKIGAWNAKSSSMHALGAVVGIILMLLFWLAHWADSALLPGMRHIPTVCLFALLAIVAKQWAVCNWRISRANAIGIDFDCRESGSVSTKADVARIKDFLKQNPVQGKRKRILVCTASSGGGHEATTQGLKDLLAEVDFPAEVVECPMAFMVETNPDNPLMSIFGVTGEQIYNWGLLQGHAAAWLITHLTSNAQHIAILADAFTGAFFQVFGSARGDVTGKMCKKLWEHYEPDLILDFTTGTRGMMYRGLASVGTPNVPIVVCVSDFEGVGVHAWIEDKRQYVICGTSLCHQQAVDFGLPKHQRYQTSGMVVRPGFYYSLQDTASTGEGGREAELMKLGLDPSVRTCLVCWGGLGSATVLEVGKCIAKSKTRVNIIFLCGRNEALAASLEQNDWQETRVLIQGFTTRVPYFMQLVDFCVCKPGPGVCSEAALVGLPMIVEWGMFTLPQEVAVGRWILDRGLGLGFSNNSQITGCVERMCMMMGEDMSTRYSPRARPGQGLSGVDLMPASNKAVFEVPMILLEIMRGHDARGNFSGAGTSQSLKSR